MTKNDWRELGIFNPHGIQERAKSKLYIGYKVQDYGLSGQGAGWAVYGRDFKTDPDGPWYDRGDKTFSVWGRDDKQTVLVIAMEWVKENYGITEWERGPWNSYFPKGTLAEAKQVSKEN